MAITIDKAQERLFIALGKSKTHTFIMLGVYQGIRFRYLLSRAGKIFSLDSDGCLQEIEDAYATLFSTLPGKLVNESILGSELRSTPISYQAYDLSLIQYIEWIRLLESIQTEDNKFHCYKPIRETRDEITFISTDELLFKDKITHSSLNSTQDLSVNNTCRHTAISLIEAVLKVPKSSLISNQFFMELPYKTELNFCMPSVVIPFYVLPNAPAAYPHFSAEKQWVMVKLYQRMETLLLLEPYSELTQAKFIALKRFYTDSLEATQELSLEELLSSVRLWKENNKPILSTLRKIYFWDDYFIRESETMSMVSDIENVLESQLSIGG